MEDPYGSGKKVALLQALCPDLTVVHVQMADAHGNGIILGSIYYDYWFGRCGRDILLIADHIVDTNICRRFPNLVAIPGPMVTGVIPWYLGAWPTNSPGIYGQDLEHMGFFIKACNDRNNLREYLDRYVYSWEVMTTTCGSSGPTKSKSSRPTPPGCWPTRFVKASSPTGRSANSWPKQRQKRQRRGDDMREKKASLDKKNGVATVTLNNPASYNSMTAELLADTFQALMEAEADPDVRAVVLTGSGKAFCAGGDLPYIATFTNNKISRKYIEDIARVTKAIVNMPKPVIAMVNGVAAGAGFNWVLACDLIFCAKSARFAQSFVKVGLIPDGGGTYFLPRAIGLHKAKELMFTADVIDAETADRMGLVNRVVEDEKLKEVTCRFAEKLAGGAPIALSLLKKILNQSDRLDLQASMEVETGVQILCLDTEDNKEGIAAFKEKRQPVFKGQ
jgi:2-(1,2-epoxy-1,2-dihydrophenyl)acetyl-CoA isomerase